VGQGGQPGAGAAPVGVEPRGGTPHVEQNLLRYLLGLGRVAQHGEDDAEDLAGRAVVDGLVGGQVAAGHPGQQHAELVGVGVPAVGGAGLALGHPHHVLNSLPNRRRLGSRADLGAVKFCITLYS